MRSQLCTCFVGYKYLELQYVGKAMYPYYKQTNEGGLTHAAHPRPYVVAIAFD